MLPMRTLLLFSGLLTLVIVAVHCDEQEIIDESDNVETTTDSLLSVQRENRQYNFENWRGIPSNRRPDSSNRAAIIETDRLHIPSADHRLNDHDSEDGYILRRRRPVRKRKRRPYPLKYANDNHNNESNNNEANNKHLRRPQPLNEQEHAFDDHWHGEAFGEDQPQNTFQRTSQKPRRRLNPVYEDFVDASIIVQADNTPDKTHSSVNLYNDHIEYVDTVNLPPISSTITTNIENSKSYRKPYASHRQTDSSDSPAITTNLKNLLKQNGGSLSLVELLQQRNLSLSDLLKGKEKAISVLANNPPVAITERIEHGSSEEFIETQSTRQFQNTNPVTEKMYEIPEKRITNPSNRLSPTYQTTIKYENYFTQRNDDNFETTPPSHARRRLPPSSTSFKSKQNNEESLLDHISEQRKRLSNLHSNRETSLHTFEDIKHLDVVTEATTERRIFIPSNYRNYKTNSSNLQSNEVNENRPFFTSSQRPYKEFVTTHKIMDTTFAITTSSPYVSSSSPIPKSTTSEKYFNTDMIIKDTRMAITRNRLALKPKLRISKLENVTPPTTTKRPDTSISSTNAFAINLEEVFGMPEIKKPKPPSDPDEPFRISMNIENNIKNPTQTIKTSTEFLLNEITVKPSTPSAEEEIMEVINDAEGRERLARILASRNMSFAELVALRERGSSQLHLADIFLNQTKEPFMTSENLDSLLHNKEKTRAQQKQRPHGSRISITAFDSFPEFEMRSPSHDPTIIEPNEIKKDSEGSSYFTSVVKILPPKTESIYRESRNFDPPAPTSDVIKDAKKAYDTPHYSHLANIQPTKIDLFMTSGSSSHLFNDDSMEEDLSKIHLSSEDSMFLDEEQYVQLPLGVKSAIIASTAVVGSSLLIFITIFVVFKWHQKRRRRLRYTNSFLGSQIRTSILESQRRKSNCANSNEVLVDSSSSNCTNVSFINDECVTNTDNHHFKPQYLWETIRKPFH